MPEFKAEVAASTPDNLQVSTELQMQLNQLVERQFERNNVNIDKNLRSIAQGPAVRNSKARVMRVVSKDPNPVSAPMSDAEFTNSSALTRSEVKQIIESHNPLLVKIGVPDLLYDAAKKYSLNPKILLSSLAQEQNWGKNGKINKIMGIDGGGGGNPAALAVAESMNKSASTYRKHYDEAVKDPRKLKMKINYDPRDNEQRPVIGAKNLASWQDDHRDDVLALHKGFSFTARTNAEYARLRYTPFTYFAPQNSLPYDDWMNLMSKLNP